MTTVLCLMYIVLLASYNMDDVTFASSILKLLIYFCSYFMFCLALHVIITKYHTAHVKLPKSDDEMREAMSYAGEQIDVLSRLNKFSWKKSIRLDVWLSCMRVYGCECRCSSHRLFACLAMVLWHVPSWMLGLCNTICN